MFDILEKLLVAIVAGMFLRSAKDVALFIVKLAVLIIPNPEVRSRTLADWTADLLERDTDDKRIIGALWILINAPYIAFIHTKSSISTYFTKVFKVILRAVVFIQLIGGILQIVFLALGWGQFFLYGYILRQYLSADARLNIMDYIANGEDLNSSMYSWLPLCLVAICILKQYNKATAKSTGEHIILTK